MAPYPLIPSQCQITSVDLYIERDVRGEKADTQRVSASVCLHVIVFDRWRPLRCKDEHLSTDDAKLNHCHLRMHRLEYEI